MATKRHLGNSVLTDSLRQRNKWLTLAQSTSIWTPTIQSVLQTTQALLARHQLTHKLTKRSVRHKLQTRLSTFPIWRTKELTQASQWATAHSSSGWSQTMKVESVLTSLAELVRWHNVWATLLTTATLVKTFIALKEWNRKLEILVKLLTIVKLALQALSVRQALLQHAQQVIIVQHTQLIQICCLPSLVRLQPLRLTLQLSS